MQRGSSANGARNAYGYDFEISEHCYFYTSANPNQCFDVLLSDSEKIYTGVIKCKGIRSFSETSNQMYLFHWFFFCEIISSKQVSEKYVDRENSVQLRKIRVE